MEVIYERQEKQQRMDNQKYLSIDCGIDNLATCSSNTIPSFIINGRPVKSINQFCNKRVSDLKSKLEKQNNGQRSSKRIHNTWRKRNFKIKDYFHKTSHYIINQCVENDINTIVIGRNKGWKQETNLGKRNNQNFVDIPFNQLIDMICYKAKLQGVNVVLQEESYTSKSSFFDNDEIPVYNSGVKQSPSFSGKRVSRGLYKTSNGLLVNADVNGSLNILRKYLNVVSERIVSVGNRGLVVRPVKINI
ncbi:MAG: RNA-guided endonuclease TnpB family protein [Lachnospiraceae bacterium]|nr:RNA-guided endonuclease TnpB family protein [Lachnospiraceae bacterium]